LKFPKKRRKSNSIMKRLVLRTAIISAAILSGVMISAAAADWSTAGGDAGRTNFTDESLPETLSLHWRYTMFHPPQRAWPSRQRLQFDRTFVPVAADGRIYFGSSADDTVYAMDATSGAIVWTFYTDGPVRFAPVVWRDRLFVTSDDGYLYCLRAANGQMIWKLRGGPRDERLPANGRVVSRWPARGGPVVAEDTVYFAAGVWPSEGIYVYAVDAASGKIRWCNDSAGAIEMSKPRSGTALSGISAQGYLTICGSTLLVPTGRAVPAALDRHTGELRYFMHAENKANGGSDVAAFDDMFVFRNNYPSTGQRIASIKDGTAMDGMSGTLFAADPQTIYYVDRERRIIGRHRKGGTRESVDRHGEKRTYRSPGDECWRADIPHKVDASLAVAGDKIIAGGENRLSLVDRSTGKTLWTTEVDGQPYGIAVDGEQLIVTTDRGSIYCFWKELQGESNQSSDSRSGRGCEDRDYMIAAISILARTQVRRGICIDLACGDGQLALELASRTTDLRIVAFDTDQKNVEAAQRMLKDTGLYGSRITVHHTDSADPPLVDGIADLVVSGRSVKAGAASVDTDVVRRLMSPYLGAAFIGKTSEMKLIYSGPLEGAGNWTHFYADAGNRFCCEDDILRGPLEANWYRDTDWEMPSRHAMSPASLVVDGRFLMVGTHGVRAVNAYNGTTLWECPITDLLAGYSEGYKCSRRSVSGNACAADGVLYVRYADRCRRIDIVTGRQLGELKSPPCQGQSWWSHLSCADELLLGSLAAEKHQVDGYSDAPPLSRLFTESKTLFGIDAKSGELRWTYRPKHSIGNNAIAHGGGRVYLIDRPLSQADAGGEAKKKELETEARRRADANNTDWRHELDRMTRREPGRLIALDATSGEIVWQLDQVEGSLLAYHAGRDALVMSNEPSSRLFADRGGSLVVYNGSTGEERWQTGAGSSRPILNGEKIVMHGRWYDLLTGESHSYRINGKSFTCGPMIASTHMLVFRSATMGYCDFAAETKVRSFGGMRIGCWIDATPAAGMVLVADGAAKCGCSYLNQATIGLRPKAQPRK